MDGMKEAHIRACRDCAHRRMAHPSVWAWPHCVFDGGDRELDDAFMDGPEANCPAGKWAGLEPVDVEGERRRRDAGTAERHAAYVKPWLDAALPRIAGPSDKGAFLVDAVAAGVLRRDVAEERAAEEGLDLE